MQYNPQERAGSKARAEIERLVDVLQIRPAKEVTDSAHRLYILGMSHNFTKGRRTSHVSLFATKTDACNVSNLKSTSHDTLH